MSSFLKFIFTLFTLRIACMLGLEPQNHFKEKNSFSHFTGKDLGLSDLLSICQ